MKEKQVVKGMRVDHFAPSPDGKQVVAWESPSYGGTPLKVIDTAKWTVRDFALPSEWSRVFDVAWLGDCLVAGMVGESSWGVVVYDATGAIHHQRTLGKENDVSGGLACASDGRVAVVKYGTLWLFAPGDLFGKAAPHKQELDCGTYVSRHVTFADDGTLLVAGGSALFQISPKLNVQRTTLGNIEFFGQLSGAAGLVAFQGSATEGEGFADGTTYVVDRKTGKVKLEVKDTFTNFALTPDGRLLGVSPGTTRLKKIGRAKWKRSERDAGGFIRIQSLDGKKLVDEPVKLARIDGACLVNDAVLIGTHKGVTAYLSK